MSPTVEDRRAAIEAFGEVLGGNAPTLLEKLVELVGDRFAGVLMEFLLPVPAGTFAQIEHELGLPRTAFE